MEAVRVYTRYDLPSSGEQTRRERNERVGVYTPSFEVPETGYYLWNWFIEINNSIHRIDFNGYYCTIPPTEFLAWSQLTKNHISPYEYEILTAMDAIYCRELNAEITAKRGREEEERKQRLNSKTSRAKRGR